MLALTIQGQTEYLADEDSKIAMKRFWQARSAGDPTARLVQTQQVPEPEKVPEIPAPPEAVILQLEPEPQTRPGQVSSLARERIQLHEQWLTDAGFEAPPPLFAPGTRVVALGDENFRIERERVENLPPFPEAARRVIDEIAKEERTDVQVGLGSLFLTDTGKLHSGAKSLGLEPMAFQQFANLAGFGLAARYFKEMCPAHLRAINLNHLLRALPDRDVVLRTRQGPANGRQVFAAVTPTYAAVDTDQVLQAVSEHLADAHTELRYDGTGIRATALWMPDQVVDLAAGDVFKAGVRVETDDTGRGRIRISGVVFRNLCLNLIIIGEGEVETVSLVHRGDPERILRIVRAGVDQAREAVGQFLEAWGHARTVKVDPYETIQKWVAERKVQVRSRQDDDAVVEELLSAWRQEPGDTLADCVNAVSRAAHQNPLWGIDIREELERQASRLVLVPR